VNLKPRPICTSRWYWFDGLAWKCLGCFPRELEGQIWIELEDKPPSNKQTGLCRIMPGRAAEATPRFRLFSRYDESGAIRTRNFGPL
jgi:hypothetical protein